MTDIKKIAGELKITANTEGGFEAKNAKSVYIGNLPEGVTEDQVKAVTEYNKAFYRGVQEAAIEPLVQDLQANSSKALATLEASALGTKFAVSLSRDDNGVSLGGSAQVAVGSYIMTAQSRATKLWSN